jgi:hypothetical protein
VAKVLENQHIVARNMDNRAVLAYPSTLAAPGALIAIDLWDIHGGGPSAGYVRLQEYVAVRLFNVAVKILNLASKTRGYVGQINGNSSFARTALAACDCYCETFAHIRRPSRNEI